jgi:energy-coupling factor transporter transmembrane protein EcfT
LLLSAAVLVVVATALMVVVEVVVVLVAAVVVIVVAAAAAAVSRLYFPQVLQSFGPFLTVVIFYVANIRFTVLQFFIAYLEQVLVNSVPRASYNAFRRVLKRVKLSYHTISNLPNPASCTRAYNRNEYQKENANISGQYSAADA